MSKTYGQISITDVTDGKDGNGINSITYYYAVTETQDEPNPDDITNTEMPAISATNKYLWQKEVINFTNDDIKDKVTVLLVAVYGDSGQNGANGITFQIYGEQGLVLTSDSPSTTLKVFAYDGDTAITDATYKWYYLGNTNTDDASADIIGWIDANVATDSFTVDRTQVFRSTSYKCEMTYKDNPYYATVIVQDKNDIYDAIINIFDTVKTADGKCYWILYTSVYTENGEVDELQWPLSTNKPEQFDGTDADHYYFIDIDNSNIILKKYENNTWINANEDEQRILNYKFNNVTDINSTMNKIAIISSDDVVSTTSVTCEISDGTNIIARPTITLTDTSDPIISSSPPENPMDGQIWIDNSDKTDTLVKIYDKSSNDWVVASGKNKIYTSKPSLYKKGDLWVTQTNEDCTYIDEGGNTQNYPALTMLTAINDIGESFNDSDWEIVLNYGSDIDNIKDVLKRYIDSVAVGNNGITITAVDANNNPSPFSSRFTSSKLAFLYDETKVSDSSFEETDSDEALTKLKITADGISTPNIEVKETIQLDGLKFIIETNGSYSITV